MSTFLFNRIIFGPVRSRRFGKSLGINLLPVTHKVCTYNCIYCECGLTLEEIEKNREWPAREEVKNKLELWLENMSRNNEPLPDNITFAGNGEPTLHPAFTGIMDDVLELRDRYCPRTRVTVLSNATIANRPLVRQALTKADNNVLKLDTGTETMFRLLNRPPKNLKLEEVIETLTLFKGQLIIQSMFVQGYINGQYIDNTVPGETTPWLEALLRIKPKEVMVYSIARGTPVEGVKPVPFMQLVKIANMVKIARIQAEVY